MKLEGIPGSRAVLIAVYVLQQVSYLLFALLAAKAFKADHMGVYATIQVLVYSPVAAISGGLESYFISAQVHAREGVRSQIIGLSIVTACILLIITAIFPIFKFGILGWVIFTLLALSAIATIAMPIEAQQKVNGNFHFLLMGRLSGLIAGSLIKIFGIFKYNLIVFAAGGTIELIINVVFLIVFYPGRDSIFSLNSKYSLLGIRKYFLVILGSLLSIIYSRLLVPAGTLLIGAREAGNLGLGLTASYLVPVLFSTSMSLVHSDLDRRHAQDLEGYISYVGRILMLVYLLTVLFALASFWLGPTLVNLFLGPTYKDLGMIGPQLVILSGILCVGEQRQRFAAIVGNRRISLLNASVGLPLLALCIYFGQAWGIKGLIDGFVICTLFIILFVPLLFDDMRPWYSILNYSLSPSKILCIIYNRRINS